VQSFTSNFVVPDGDVVFTIAVSVVDCDRHDAVEVRNLVVTYKGVGTASFTAPPIIID
jgi:hypothetical protein